MRQIKLLSIDDLFIIYLFLNRNRISFMLFNELWRFLGEIETDNLTVSNSEIITLDFSVWKIAFS